MGTTRRTTENQNFSGYCQGDYGVYTEAQNTSNFGSVVPKYVDRNRKHAMTVHLCRGFLRLAGQAVKLGS